MHMGVVPHRGIGNLQVAPSKNNWIFHQLQVEEAETHLGAEFWE